MSLTQIVKKHNENLKVSPEYIEAAKPMLINLLKNMQKNSIAAKYVDCFKEWYKVKNIPLNEQMSDYEIQLKGFMFQRQVEQIESYEKAKKERKKLIQKLRKIKTNENINNTPK